LESIASSYKERQQAVEEAADEPGIGKKIEDFDWSTRTHNIFKKMQITQHDLSYLGQVKKTDLMLLKNCGVNTVREIEYELKQYGLALL